MFEVLDRWPQVSADNGRMIRPDKMNKNKNVFVLDQGIIILNADPKK